MHGKWKLKQKFAWLLAIERVKRCFQQCRYEGISSGISVQISVNLLNLTIILTQVKLCTVLY